MTNENKILDLTPLLSEKRSYRCGNNLEITGVRVERLNEINEEDCCADGGFSRITRDFKKPKFQALWTSVYREGSWIANPWVWAIEFRRIK